MSDKDKAMQQALEAGLESDNPYIRQLAANAVRKARVQPGQEPTPWRDMVVVSLVREGINKHKARELVDHFAAQPEQEPVSMRMPKVGDKVICIEDESLGEVVSLTAGGSPDILFADGSHGTYLLREFAELFGYVASPLPVQPEPVTWDKPSDNFNAWWDGDRRRDTANPFTTDSFSYWAWEGWQAALAQRQWVGLNDVDVKNLELTSATSSDVRNISAELKEKNT